MNRHSQVSRVFLAAAVLVGLAAGARDALAIDDDPDPQYCGDGICSQSERNRCHEDCDPPDEDPEDPGPVCGPFSRLFTRSTGFAGEILSGTASVTGSVDGSMAGVRDRLNVNVTGTVLGQSAVLLDVNTTGSADMTSSNGVATITVAGATIFAQATSTAGTIGYQQPLKTWTIWQVAGETPTYCDPWLQLLCARAAGTIQVDAQAGLEVSQTVAPASVDGFMGPYGSVTASVTGTASMCIWNCNLGSIDVLLSGAATIADLTIGAFARGKMTTATEATSDLSIGAQLALGAGTIDIAVRGCMALFGCTTFWSANGANWGAPVSLYWNPIGGAQTHCL